MEFVYALILLAGLGHVYAQPYEGTHSLPWNQPSRYWGDKGLDMMFGWKPQFRPGEVRWPKRQAPPEIPADDPVALSVAAKQSELQSLLQQLYQAEAAVKMESGEVSRTEEVAAEAERNLEVAANKVRMASEQLQAAQEAAASAAMRAQTAHLQLSAHDQLMFTARRQVDDLSAKMDSVQAELAAAQQEFTLANSTQHLQQQGNIGQPQPPNFTDEKQQPLDFLHSPGYHGKRLAPYPYALPVAQGR